MLLAKPSQRGASANSDFVIGNAGGNVIGFITLDHDSIRLQMIWHSSAVVECHQSGQHFGLQGGLCTNQIFGDQICGTVARSCN
jgi:hypothetical protein